MMKIQRTFVRQEAYIAILQWILDGTLAPGAQLRDKDLAENLGVSRTPIREALLRLEDEGFVKTKPNRSTLVSTLDLHNALYLYSIVWTLERLAMSQAFEFITEQNIQMMIEANERLNQAMKTRDHIAAVEADNDFHAIYIKLSQNEELEKIILELKQKVKRLDLYYFDKIKDASFSYQEHNQIIRALKQRDLLLTLDAVENNWKKSFSRFTKE